MDELIRLIRSWSARARLQRSLWWLFLGLAWGLGVALGVAVLSRLFPLLDTATLITIAIACAALGALCAVLWPWLRTWRMSPAAWARQFDQQFRLKQRLSTALELREGTLTTRNDNLRKQQQADAEQAAETVDIHKLLPLRFSKRYFLFSLAIGLALAVAIALPNPQQEVLANRAQLQQVMEEQLQQVEAVKQQVEESTALNEEQKNEVIQALDEAEQTLSDPNTTPEQAMAAINDAQSKLDALRDQEWPDQRDDLQRAGQSMAPDEQTNSLANSLENGNFEQAAEDLRNVTEQRDGKPLSEEQRQRVAEQLEQMARNMQNSDPATAQQLREAAQKLREGKDAEARELLQQVAEKLQQAGQKEAANQQIEQAQATMEDTRRAVSEMSQSQANAGQEQQGQNSQAGNNTAAQQQSGNQSGQASAQQDQQGQAGAQQAIGQGEASNAQAAVSGNAQGAPGEGNPLSGHHEDTGSDNSVYAPPPRLAADGEGVRLEEDKGRNIPNPNANTNPGVENSASVPYQQVYPQYAEAADQALQNGEVPSDLRDYVRDYFSSLDPRQRR